ncbi:MAG: MscL family protein [Candidatus Lokiarchaeota archaeon]|nr:MscL family protein [Candidatus Lokiarchaeota archaeon]
MDEFKEFLIQYKVMGLAVAFIMGLYLGALVKSLVDNLVMPIVELFTPEGFAWEAFTLGPFRVGSFIGDLITFLIIALVIFLIVKLTTRLGIK